jgi:hypothetical protein
MAPGDLAADRIGIAGGQNGGDRRWPAGLAALAR